MTDPDRIPIAPGVVAAATRRGIELRRQVSGDAEEIVAIIEWPALDLLRASRPEAFLHLIAGADR